ncbi:MAG: NAD(P)/FAD-dependent oxidoreductase [Spirochaetia bacterium]
MDRYDVVIVGTGPAGMGAAFTISEERPDLSVLMLDTEKYSSGGLRNDCKMNFTYPIGFPTENWSRQEAEHYLELVKRVLAPTILPKTNLLMYKKRAERLGVELLDVQQTHLGTDGGLELIKELMKRLREHGVEFALGETMRRVSRDQHNIETDKREIGYGSLIIAPGRRGFRFLQEVMDSLGISYVDHIVDIGIRVETRVEHFPIVRDYYDPKFIFPGKVRTFCTNSGNAYVVQERYTARHKEIYYSVNGHAYSAKNNRNNGLVNFAMLKTVRLTEPLASGQQFAEILGLQAHLLGGGRPLMQRIGDFRLGKRSKENTFNEDLFDFQPTLKSSCPGDISLSIPSKILRNIWKSLKMLDTIVPGILHPSTIMYYPEIKLYANKPSFIDRRFKVAENIYFAGDGAGTSRGITAAWASGIRVAEDIV